MTCAEASSPARACSSEAPRSAASRISRTCSAVPLDSEGTGAVDLRLELVGHAPEVLVDRRRVVAAATGGEVAAFDLVAIHGSSA